MNIYIYTHIYIYIYMNVPSRENGCRRRYRWKSHRANYIPRQRSGIWRW